MASPTHGAYWLALVLGVAIAVGALSLATVRQLQRLRRQAGIRVDHPTTRPSPSFLGLVGPLWGRLFLVAVALFGVQENVESVIAGLPAPGTDALAAHGLLPMLVIGVVSALIAVVAGLVAWHRLTLLARLRSAAPTWSRSAPRGPRHGASTRPASSHVPGHLAIRGPPRRLLTRPLTT